MSEIQIERKIQQILTNKRLSALKDYLGKDHSVDCLLVLYLDYGKWQKAKNFAECTGFSISFHAYKSRMKELEGLELATSFQIDPLKKRYLLTD